MAITDNDIKQIKEILRDEYSQAEVDDMISNATITKDDNGVLVTYDNGVKDLFAYKQVLYHVRADISKAR